MKTDRTANKLVLMAVLLPGCVASLLLACIEARGQTAQTWVTVAHEDDTITAAAPLTYRYGVPQGTANGPVACSTPGGCWDAPVTTSGPLRLQIYTSSFTGDPAPDLVKTLQVLETVAAQTVIDTPPGGASATVTIPALPAPAVTPAAPVPVAAQPGVPSSTPTATAAPAASATPVKTWTCAVPASTLTYSLLSDGTWEVTNPLPVTIAGCKETL